MKYFSLITAMAALGMVVSLQEFKEQVPLTENTSFGFNEGFANFSSTSLELMSFGYSRVMSNLLWLRYLEQTPNKKIPDHNVSWMYLDLDTLTTIDPEFKPGFEYGGIFLSVITEDRIGAEQILKKGISLFPQSWQLHAHLAYHYQFELHDDQKAYEQYLAGSKIEGAPPLLGIIAARYISRKDSISAGIAFLQNLANTTKDPFMKEKIIMRMQDYEKRQHEQANH